MKSMITKTASTLALALSSAFLFGACMSSSEEADDDFLTNEEMDALTAASSEIGTLATCDVQIGVTTRTGNLIQGYGSLSNCPNTASANVRVYRSRWDGWEAVGPTETARGGAGNVYVTYNCAGTGTHDFRTRIWGTTIGGTPKNKTSNVIYNVSC